MRTVLIACAALVFVGLGCNSGSVKTDGISDGWISLFNGVDLDGWKASEREGCFSVEDGAIKVNGNRSHLFYVGDIEGANFKNFEFMASVKTTPGSNSGIYFHTKYQQEGWPKNGYETQVNISHKDPQKSGGLYGAAKVSISDLPAKDNEWYTHHIIVMDKHVIVKINGEEVVNYIEADDVSFPGWPGRKLSSGTFAIQAHDPKSLVYIKDIKVKPLPLVIAEKVKVVEGLDLPECLVIDPDSGDIYVSNVVTSNEGYWEDDGNGFISRLSAGGEIKDLRWLESTDEMAINAPKGMCISGGKLYFNDNDTLKYCSLGEPGKVGVIKIEGTEKLNDLAVGGGFIWTTDTGTGKAFRVNPDDGAVLEIPAPEAINGITFYNGSLFAVSWDLHEVYQLDPKGETEPVAFGVADNFKSLDCIEVLDDGSFVVTDWKGNAVYSITADRKTVTKLYEVESAADLALDRQKKLLYVPAMLQNKAVILKIK